MKSVAYVTLAVSFLLLLATAAGETTSFINVQDKTWPYVSCFIELSSALLLFVTLNQQDRSFKHERFETTFFNLLNNHRKFTDELKIKTELLKDDLSRDKHTYKGRDCFWFAEIERCNIYNALLSDKYEGFIDEYDDLNIEDIEKKLSEKISGSTEYQKCEQKLEKARKDYRCRYYNKRYRIDEETYKRVNARIKGNNNFMDVNGVCHWIFYKKTCEVYFEHYIRSLTQILKHIYQKMPCNARTHDYAEYVVSQMSFYEIKFIAFHSKYFKHFNEICRKSGMYDILKEKWIY